MTAAPIWVPAADRVASSGIARFRDHLVDAGVGGIADSRELHNYSCQHPGEFWRHLWRFTRLVGEPGPVDIVGDSFETTMFFPDGTIDVAASMLAGPDDDIVVVACDENGDRERLTRRELRARVAATAAVLRTHGVGRGDVVAAWSTVDTATLTVMLATAACGAIFTSCSAEFGVDAVVDRFAQVEPVVLFVVDRYEYAGRTHDVRCRAEALVNSLRTLRLVLTAGDVAIRRRDVDTGDIEPILRSGDGVPLATTSVAFNDAGSILYSSGTTGRPKCIRHRAGGVLLKHASEHLLHCDIRATDRVFYYTTTSWMMWNWLVSALAVGAGIVLYSGAPLSPEPHVLLDLAARERITYFGTSPSYLDALRRAGAEPAESHDLSAIRTVGVTGSPLSTQTAQYASTWADQVHVLSKSGGTDLCGGLLSGDPTRPAYAGEIQAPAFGCSIAVVDDVGADLPTGETGELVSRTPFPSMPLGYIGDDGTRLHDQYYARYAGCWHQSDFVSRTTHGGFIVHGRSDTTLNINGVRIGTAEIYSQVERLSWVGAAAAVAFDANPSSTMVLLIEVNDQGGVDEPRRDEVRQLLRERCSPRHVPAIIESVPELPRTMNGKLSEVAVTHSINQRDTDGWPLANPNVLEAIRRLGEQLRTEA